MRSKSIKDTSFIPVMALWGCTSSLRSCLTERRQINSVQLKGIGIDLYGKLYGKSWNDNRYKGVKFIYEIIAFECISKFK